ncbi:MAG TPA: hypothetical protein VN030_06580 [Cellvibrio sp.]|nr:hypothetical protein [Cellvibrio sp.]
MAVTSIARVVNLLEELLGGLDQAYWESSKIDRKDFFYDLISAVNLELSELSKLSVQDHDLDWEPITHEFRLARPKLNKLRKLLDEHVLRSTTAARLEILINDVVALPLR